MKDKMRLIQTDLQLKAPTVGRYLNAPPVGTCLSAGSPAGNLKVLQRTFDLVVPPDGGGIVAEVMVRGRAVAVEYGQPLLRLTRDAAQLDFSDGGGAAGRAPASGAAAIPDGMFAIRAPTDGIFYRRPSPEEPMYVNEGDRVTRGQVLGLVEVMKCFNQITYGGDGMPDTATVVKIFPEDSGEVKHGGVLFVLEP
jgi:acetyl-CoA carboxylase biotin carboxyl carrier protein